MNSSYELVSLSMQNLMDIDMDKIENFKNLEKTWSVYLLTCDKTPNVCYIGITNKTYAIERLFYHFVESVSDSQTDNKEKHQWIIANWRDINMQILESRISLEEDARLAESKYVFDYRYNKDYNVLNKTYVAVRCFDTFGVFYKDYASYAEAAKDHNTLPTRIIQCVRNGNSLFKQFYFIKYDKNITHFKVPESKSIDRTPILQYDSDGNFLKEWKSALDVCTSLNIDRSYIMRLLKDHTKATKGFHFIKKVSEDIPEKIEILGKIKIELYDTNDNLLGKFGKVMDAAKFLIDNNYTHGKPENVQSSLSKNGKIGKLYKGIKIVLYDVLETL